MATEVSVSGNGRIGPAIGLEPDRVNTLVDAVRRRGAAEVDGKERSRPVYAGSPAGDATELSFAIDVFGVRIGISLEDSNLLGAVVDRLPPGWQPAKFSHLDQHYRFSAAPAPGTDYVLWSGDSRLAVRRQTWAGVLDAFESMAEDYVAEYARPWLFLHAGVVGWRGRAIVVPGNSFSGKSTLITALVGAGAEYYSDEFAVLDRNGWVYPFSRPIALRRSAAHGGWEHQRLRVTDGQGLSSTSRPMPVAVVALLAYNEYADSWPERLDNGTSVMALCGHAVAVRERPTDAFAVLGTLVRSATVIRGDRGQAEDAASWLLSTEWGDV